MTLPVAAAPAESTCPKCSAMVASGERFCARCGAPMAPDAAGARGRRRLGNLAGSAHDANIRKARGAIVAVAILQLLVTFFLMYQFNDQVDTLRQQGVADQQAFDEAVAQGRMQIYALFLIPVAFAGLWVWSKRNPFGASLTALIIYVTLHAVDAAVDPTAIMRGIIIKVIVVVLLLNGVKAGLAHRRLNADAAA